MATSSLWEAFHEDGENVLNTFMCFIFDAVVFSLQKEKLFPNVALVIPQGSISSVVG